MLVFTRPGIFRSSDRQAVLLLAHAHGIQDGKDGKVVDLDALKTSKRPNASRVFNGPPQNGCEDLSAISKIPTINMINYCSIFFWDCNIFQYLISLSFEMDQINLAN